MAWRFPFSLWRWRCSTSSPSGSCEPAGLSRSYRHDSGDPAVRSLANPRERLFRAISQGRCEYSVGNDRSLRTRDAGRTDHISFHAGPGLRKWDRFHPKLFWATTRTHCRVRGFRSDLSAAKSLHSLPIPGAAIRSEDTATRRIPVPRAKRNSGRDHNLCAGYCSVCLAGGLVIIYTVAGGTKIVSITQRYQMIVILVGMAIAFVVAVYRLSPDLSFEGALSVAGKMGKLEAVDFSVDPHKRYTFWSGLIGGFFLALSYFGADQSQVQRYLAGGSLKESRLGLLFNATVKVPMQFFILLLGALVFMFYQFEEPPVYFNRPAYERAVERGYGPQLAALQKQFDDVFAQKRAAIRALSNPSSNGSSNERDVLTTRLRELDAQAHEVRNRTKAVLEQAGADPKSKESDYVFITFILQQMPHGGVGLLIAVILCATMSATAATL